MTINDLPVMADIMNEIINSDQWQGFQLKDPYIRCADKKWNEVFERVKQYLPADMHDELSEADTVVIAAYCDSALLYGIHLGAVLCDFLAAPEQLSRFYAERMSGART